MAMNHLFLYGPSCSGKSAAGLILAKALDLPFYDLDKEIESHAGTTIDAIFEQEGEAHFRVVEKAILAETIQKSDEAIIALGGGALLNTENRVSAEAAGRILCLRAGVKTLLGRLAGADSVRPLLNADPENALKSYLNNRATHYDSFPYQLNTDPLSLDETAWEAQKLFGHFRIKQMGNPYDVRVKRGSLSVLGYELEKRGLGGPICVVADTNTEIYGKQAVASLTTSGYSAFLKVIPAGETHKTIDTVQELWSAFLAHGLERGSTIVAVGGGVVGDLAGFAAATYLRGIQWVSVPTTLLAMVDASIGGKTGADLPVGKNLIGAFHAPALVQVDPDVLTTLPEREIRAGMAEVIKAAVIADYDLFTRCQNIDLKNDLAAIIPAAMSIKIQIIENDPYESSVRALLNFGHTIGHAVEHGSGFDLLHGEAIAIGMHLETKLAEKLGIATSGLAGELVKLLQQVGLPTEIPPGIPSETLLKTMQLDKKKVDGELKFALPERIGDATLVRLAENQYKAVFI
jgi:3-dehydroquinate synthase